jgi:hypothetical protein
MALQKFGTYFSSFAREGGEANLIKIDMEDDLLAKVSIETLGQERGALYLDAEDLHQLGELMIKFAKMIRSNDEAYDDNEDDEYED